MKTAKISEIFYSFQGEGLYQGVSQVFVRFSGCNLSCIFCDTESSSCRIYNVDDLLRAVFRGNLLKEIHSVAITGGEPLCQAEFLLDFLPGLRQNGCRIYLETNGILYEELQDLMPYIDIVAMDFKLPSSTGLRAFWREHEEFLRIALDKSRPFLQDNNSSQRESFVLEESKPKTREDSKKGRDEEVFVKVVVTDRTTREDWQKAVDVIFRVAPQVLLVLQPGTPVGDCKWPSEAKINVFKSLALEKLDRVDVVPQIHPVLGIK